MLRSWNFFCFCFSLLFYLFICGKLKEECPDQWITSIPSRSCIWPVLIRKTWTRARDSCKTVRADLLIRYNKEKEKLIYEKPTYSNFEFWIGLNDRSHEGDFNWLDKKEKIIDIPWKNNETGRNNRGKNCVVIERKRNHDAHFLDHSCFRRAFYICEFFTTCADQTYGANCSEKCSTNCRGPNNDCEDVKGFCIFGCDDGYQGEKCEKACNSKKFGANCSETCSKMCSGPKKACNNVNGFCISGCIDGYEGERCQDQIASSLGQIGIKNNFIKTNETDDRKSPNDLPLKSLAAVSALILSVCLLFAIIFVQVEARRKNGTENAVGQNSGSANEAWCENGTLDAVGQSTESITNKEVANQSQVQLSNIPELLEDNHDNDNPHRQERMSTKEERTRQESYLPEPMQYPFKKVKQSNSRLNSDQKV